MKIPKRESRCSQHGEFFLPEQEVISLLKKEEEEWKRQDFCVACWEKEPRKGIYFRAKIPAPQKKQISPDSKALTLFQQLIETKENPKFLSLLTLYLVWKKQLIKRANSLYEVAETEELFEVSHPYISPEEGKILATQLTEQLDGNTR
ncbi:MAG: hypothetical protein K940chlam9_00325 [Chlamydiae bacterium]|nr:hypothetical protein [Chlamydiota bacterium]